MHYVSKSMVGSQVSKYEIKSCSVNPLTTLPHCNYLNIYISRKIRLCVVDLEGQFQTTLPAKPINFSIWKFRSIILIFLLFFAGVVKSSAFCTLLMLFQRVEILELQFDAKTLLKWFNLLGIASTVCKKY